MRRVLVLAALGLGAGAGAWYAWRPAAPPRNLILISIDTLRADHLGAYGYERDTSPNLDRFARRSVVFERAVAQGDSTAPSHGALLSSLYYSAYKGPERKAQGLPDGVDTLAEILQRHGFATWGFVDGGYLRRAFGFDQGFDEYDDRQVGLENILPNVERRLDASTAERFFLFLHCYDVHTPYDAPDPYRTMFDDPAYRGSFLPDAVNLQAVIDGKREMSPEDLRHVIARYDAGIRYTDALLGSFFASLERRGLLASTAIVVLSDHGEEFLEHGRLMHWQTYYMPNLHVPLLVFVPGGRPRRVAETVELIDVLPTVLDLLGLPPHAGAMGRSLAPLIAGRGSGDGADGVAYADPTVLHWRTVVSGHYQLFYNPRSGRRRLYDLDGDPTARIEAPEVEARLLAVLRDRMARAAARNPGHEAPAAAVDAETREQLRRLGYVDDAAPSDD